MSLLASVGTFAKPTTAPPAVQQITGLGFQPKAIIFHGVGATALATPQTGHRLMWGLTAGPGACAAVCSTSTHNVNPAPSAAGWYANPIVLINPNATLAALADLTSFDNDGFTLTWSTNDARADLLSYIALGGDTITAAALDSVVLPSTATYTRAGTADQPTVAFAIGSHWSNEPINTIAIGRSAAFGIATARGTAAQISFSANHNQSSDGFHVSGPSALFLAPTISGANPAHYVYPPRFTPDGYVFRSQQVSGAVALSALLLTGPHATISLFPKPIATPSATLALTPHPTGAPLIIAAHAPTYQTSGTTVPSRITFGAATPSAQFATRIGGHWTTVNNTTMYHATDCLLTDAPSNTGTPVTVATVADLDSTPVITLTPNTSDPTTLFACTLTDQLDAIAPDRALVFPMWDAATGKTPTAGLTVTAQRSTDGAAFTACTNAVTEISDGYYRLVLAPADRAGTAILFKLTAPGALTQSVQLLSR